MPVVLDTHAWLWWVDGGRRLSRPATRSIDRAQASDDLWLSMISVWEIGKKIEKRQLLLDRPLDEWLDAALALPGLQIAELTRPVLAESCRLPQPFHDDPADQIIVATARDRGATIVTKDDRILSYRHVRSVW
ncbi:MAG TPA: type II toxin-antitoxin system VapC family toxin [Vicinamibacterales bacterium]|nr:type II toxin-antitoxin system VapC family toxin [Vicinamibacterales bacterium]